MKFHIDEPTFKPFLTNSGHHLVPTWYESLFHISNYTLAFESLNLDFYQARNGLLKLREKSGIFPFSKVDAWALPCLVHGAHAPPLEVLCSTIVHNGADDFSSQIFSDSTWRVKNPRSSLGFSTS
ncbi:hypothetical protein DVH24_033374 [Malus domestica]|uniref:Uncharacterized protein n=1 Tax=Malus domestica TaxID=3750 RepID=A0A498J9W3_MALDO|nr:hypothetical protein DVH24_033374 [Malus domestica]